MSSIDQCKPWDICCYVIFFSSGVPPPVTNLTYTPSYGLQTLSIVLDWAHPMTDPDTEYIITATGAGVTSNFTANTTQFPLNGLLYNTAYGISVEATNSNGSSTPTVLAFFQCESIVRSLRLTL